MALRTERNRVTPRTYKDDNGDWITLAAVDANTLYPRPATKKEIEDAKNPAPDPDEGLAKPDSSTRVSGESLPPASRDVSLANLKATIDEINIREARKKDEEARYAKWAAEQDKPPERGHRGKPDPAPSL